MRIFGITAIFCLFISCSNFQKSDDIETGVLVIGGGTGGISAGISAARLGVKVIVVEESPWLGGMISTAGVTCTDGNHNMPSGLWGEFRDKIYSVYGGPQAVATGWVSHTQFEPHVSDSIWKTMAKAEINLQVMHGWRFEKTISANGRVAGAQFTNKAGEILVVKATISIDATELGDAMASAGVPFSLGMEAGNTTDENVGVTETNDIVQDLTWVAVLKDYGRDADCTIAKPTGYQPEEFEGVCTDYYNDTTQKAPNVDAKKMLDYGRLPNGKYMINWPNAGNDTYLNVVNLSPDEREKELEKAKQTTLRFVYFIQHQLGFKHLGLTDDEFPTEDRLALMPYHREGRRLQGLVRMNIKNIATPFTYGDPLYRTGISVGDYPIDHHHKKNLAAPQHLEFYPVPSYNIPLGALIPEKETGLIVAEKGISVTNVVNGTTRLQPVVILTGQAAGTLAALSIQQGKPPKEVAVRDVQTALLKQKAYLMPYYDVKPDDPHFDVIQRIGATGLLKGKGEPFQWANRTWFYPDSTMGVNDFVQELNTFNGSIFKVPGNTLDISTALFLVHTMVNKQSKAPMYLKFSDPKFFIPGIEAQWDTWGLTDFNTKRNITRRELAVVLDHTLNPFMTIPVNHKGQFIQ
jgi:hypothetical protein